MVGICETIHGLKPAMMMVAVQIALAGVNIFYKLASDRGMSLQIVIAYRFIFAFATVVPFALILERKSWTNLTWKTAFQSFLCALFGGSMAQNLYAESLALTSATYAAATTNLTPAVTFLLAILFRMERLELNTGAGKAKVVGTLLCIGGAMLLSFYKGFQINIWSTHFDLLQNHSAQHVAQAHHSSLSIPLGPLLALLSCISIASSFIIQARMSEAFPCHLSSTALITAMGSLQAVVYALSVERDWNQWKLGWNLRLLSAFYTGVFGAALVWAFIMSAVRMRGPLYVSIFNPLLLVLVALAGSLLLDEKLYLGSVLGAIVIIGGLYCVLWGKGKEMRQITRLVSSHRSELQEPIESNIDGSSFKGSSHHSPNILAVAPNFMPDNQINVVQVVDSEEDVQDFPF